MVNQYQYFTKREALRYRPDNETRNLLVSSTQMDVVIDSAKGYLGTSP